MYSWLWCYLMILFPQGISSWTQKNWTGLKEMIAQTKTLSLCSDRRQLSVENKKLNYWIYEFSQFMKFQFRTENFYFKDILYFLPLQTFYIIFSIMYTLYRLFLFSSIYLYIHEFIFFWFLSTMQLDRLYFTYVLFCIFWGNTHIYLYAFLELHALINAHLDT